MASRCWLAFLLLVLVVLPAMSPVGAAKKATKPSTAKTTPAPLKVDPITMTTSTTKTPAPLKVDPITMTTSTTKTPAPLKENPITMTTSTTKTPAPLKEDPITMTTSTTKTPAPLKEDPITMTTSTTKTPAPLRKDPITMTTSIPASQAQCPKAPAGCKVTMRCSPPATTTTTATKTTKTTKTPTSNTPQTTKTAPTTTVNEPTTTTTPTTTTEAPTTTTTTTEPPTTTTTEAPTMTTTTVPPTTTTTTSPTTTNAVSSMCTHVNTETACAADPDPQITQPKCNAVGCCWDPAPDATVQCYEARVPRDCESTINTEKNTCYWLAKPGRLFHDHEARCKNGGGNLATLDSKVTSDFVWNFLTDLGYTSGVIWIGYNETNGGWNDGSPFLWDNYYPGQPDPNEDCTCMLLQYSGRWGNYPCTTSMYGLCQKYIDCLGTYQGLEYRGNLAVTIDGKTCQAWSASTPHPHPYTHPAMYPDTSLQEASNYCRNPNQDPEGPWCYTTDSGVLYGYCDIPTCDAAPPPPAPPEDCLMTEQGTKYVGHHSETKKKYKCQPWRAQVPHPHNVSGLEFPDKTVRDAANFCRNPGPDTRKGPWCYTMNTNKEWDYCNIDLC